MANFLQKLVRPEGPKGVILQNTTEVTLDQEKEGIFVSRKIPSELQAHS